MKTLKPIQKIFHSKDLNIAYEKGKANADARWKKKIKEKQFEWYSQPQDDNIVKWIMDDFKELLGEE